MKLNSYFIALSTLVVGTLASRRQVTARTTHPPLAGSSSSHPSPPSPGHTPRRIPGIKDIGQGDYNGWRCTKELQDGTQGYTCFASKYEMDHGHEKATRKGVMKIWDRGTEAGTNMLWEVSFMKKLNHPHILKVYDSVKTDKKVAYITEVVSGGDLFTYVDKHIPNEQVAKVIFLPIVDALTYMHDEMNMIHKDIKLENILIDADGAPHLIDFGFAADLNSQVHGMQDKAFGDMGTMGYAAPELFDVHPHPRITDVKALDVFSICATIETFLRRGRHPDNSLKYAEPGVQSHVRRQSPEFQDLMKGCLAIDPKKRPTMRQVLNHPWFRNAKMPHWWKGSPRLETHSESGVSNEERPTRSSQPARPKTAAPHHHAAHPSPSTLPTSIYSSVSQHHATMPMDEEHHGKSGKTVSGKK